MAAPQQPAAPAGGLLNRPAELTRLLWEASITRNGGFFLYYFDTVAGGGLPDRVFNDRGQAQLTLLVLHARPDLPGQQNRLTDHMNTLVTGEPFESTHATLYAEADPPAGETIETDPDVSLADAAGRSFSDVGDLAEHNAALELREKAEVRVGQGVYQAPVNRIQVRDIADLFSTTVDALRAANPLRTDLQPDTFLSHPDALRLPALRLTAGVSGRTGTLAEVGTFCGEDLAALGADNADVPGLFADGQLIRVTGGPMVRTPSVPQGVVAFRAERPVPAAVPADPDADGFARRYLLHHFTLLGYRVEENAAFTASPLGIPAGPTVEQTAPHDGNKLRTVPAPADDETWTYALTVPYTGFAKGSPGRYAGVGGVLRTSFDWLDQFGNRLVTTLSAPAAKGRTPLGRPPALAGYADPLVGLGQWPAVSPDWRVATADGKPAIELRLAFDATRYAGLLAARAVNGTTVEAEFTEAVDPASAQAAANYTISPHVPVTEARLQADGRTVRLTVHSLPAGVLTLRARDIGPKAPSRHRDLGGTAAFHGEESARSSTAQLNAARDLRMYLALLDQLTDPSGIALTVATTLVVDKDGRPKPLPLDGPHRTGLLRWLGSVKEFLTDRADFGTTTQEPAAAHTLAIPLDPTAVNPAQLFKLSVSFTMGRTGGAVLGGLATVPGIRRATTAVPPRHEKTTGKDPSLGLAVFADSFEKALSRSDQLLKVASGADRGDTGPGAAAALWAVRVGLEDGVPVRCALKEPGEAGPLVFVPRPAATALQSRSAVQIREFRTGEGLVTPVPRDFTGVDLDLWCRGLFAAVDSVLTPRYTAALQILARQPFGSTRRDWLDELLSCKRKLAEIAETWLTPVFADQRGAAPATARAAYRQQLLSRLSEAYATRAAVEFQAEVTADIGEPLAQEPPRLYGGMALALTDGNRASDGDRQDVPLTSSSPKLTLRTGTRPLTFVLSGPEVVHDREGGVVKRAAVDLAYRPTAIEHQIGEGLGGTDYRPSSWLAFVRPGGFKELTPATFDVPLPLRAFPDSPILTVQTGKAAATGTERLGDLTRWDYAFTYTRPFHYPQDEILLEVRFNVRDTALAWADTLTDPFPHLAQFTTAFPGVRADLDRYLARIDATSDPAKEPDTFRKAAVAVDALLAMLTALTPDSAAGPLTAAPPPAAAAGVGNPAFPFVLSESAETVAGVPDTLVVEVRPTGTPPTGIGVPRVLVEPDVYETVPLPSTEEEPGTHRFAYRKKTAPRTYLPASRGQAIPARTVVLSGLDILAFQDAWAVASLERNRHLVPNRELDAPFVFTTAGVSFPNPLHPHVDLDTRVNIADLGTSARKALDQHFLTLFETLLLRDGRPKADAVTVRAEVTYRYPLNRQLPPVSLPLLVQPPAAVTLDPQRKELKALCATWSRAVGKWFGTRKPLGGGELCLDLTLVSDLTRSPMPLLRLRGLHLPLDRVEPPLPALAP